MADFTLTVYQPDDVTPLFEVGTAVGHARPYLHVPDEFAEAEIDLENGKALIGQINVKVIDPQDGATQDERWITNLLANASGFSAINGSRAVFQQVSPAVTVLDGVGYGIALNDSFSGFSLQIRDIRERGRKVSAFTRSGTSTVLPRGVLNGYGQKYSPDGPWLIAPTTPLRGKFKTTVIDFGTVGTVELTDNWLKYSDRVVRAEHVFTAAMESVNESRGRGSDPTRALWLWPHLQVLWRAVGDVVWNEVNTVAINDSGGRPPNLFDTIDARLDKKDGQAVQGITRFYLGSGAAEALPSNGQAIEFIIVYAGAPTEKFPFHFEGTWGTFVRNLLRGDYCGLDESGNPTDPRIRYESAVLTSATGPFAVPVRIRLTEPEDDIRTVLEELCKAIGAAPALNADGEISPIRYAVPDATVTLAEINDGNAQPIPGWGHPADNAVTVVEVTYPRDFAVPATLDPLGERSAGDGIASRDVVIRKAPDDLVAALGEQELKIDAWMFHALGGTEGQPISGDVGDEYGAQIAIERQHQALDRFGYGGVSSFARIMASEFPGTKEGDWVLDARSWRPNYQTGERGGNALAQIVSLRRLNPAWWEARLIDAGPADSPIGQPTLGTVTITGDGVASVPVDALPAGGEARIDYAVNATLPGTTSPLWTFLGRVAATGTLLSPPQAAGKTIWIRSRGEQVGRRPSAWTTPVNVTAPSTPRVLSSYLTLDEATGQVTVSWETNASTLGVRVYYALHVDPNPALTLYEDADAADGSMVLPVTLAPGESITVEIEPWTGWTGVDVSGSAGDRKIASVTTTRTADGTSDGINDLRPTLRTPDAVTYEWSWGANVMLVKLQTALVAQPVTSDEWPDEADPAFTELFSDRVGDVAYTFDVAPPGHSLLVQWVPILSDGTVGELARAEIQATGTEPDVINSLVPLINDDDGSVSIRIEVSERTGSVRYATSIGTSPSWPSDAAVEAGTVVVPVAGIITISLAAASVAYNQSLRIKAAPYVNADGTGTDGATDHGEIKASEDIRLKPPVSLEITTESDTSTQGTLGVTVRDPGGYGTGGLYVRTKAGEAAWTSWTLVTATPANGVEYSQVVALIEGHQSFVEFRLGYAIHGSSGYVYALSAGFDKGAIPNVTIIPRINEDTGAASCAIEADSDTSSVKVVALTSGYPTATQVRAATAINGRNLKPSEIGTLVTPTLGQVVYYAAFGYSLTGGGGEESSALVFAEAQFKIIAPILEVDTESEDGTNGTFTVMVRDPAGQADALYVREKVGDAAWSSWTLKSGAPADGITYSESVALVEDHLSFVEFRLDYVLAGDAQSIHLGSAGFDKGKVPDLAITPRVQANGEVIVDIQGDFDMASAKVAASKSAYPSDATVRAAGVSNGRTGTTGTLVTLEVGETAYIGAFGYSQTGGAGVESSAKIQTSVTRMAFIAPKVGEQMSRSGTTATLELTISDPLKKVTAIEWKESVQGASYGSYSGTWNSSSGTPGSDALLTRSLSRTISDGKDVLVTYRVSFTDENGTSREISNTVSMANLASLSKKLRLPPHAFVPASHAVTYVMGNYLQPSSLVSQTYTAPIMLPPGVTLTKVTVLAHRTDNAQGVSGNVVAASGSDPTSISTLGSFTMSAFGAGWTANVMTLSHSMVDSMVYVNVTLDAATDSDYSRIGWVEVEYTSGDYSKSL